MTAVTVTVTVTVTTTAEDANAIYNKNMNVHPATPARSAKRTSCRRILLSPFLISFLSFSLVGCCSSEALVSSSTSFLPRSLWMRGGSEGTKQSNKNPSLTCVLQVPRSSTAKMGGLNQNDSGESNTNAASAKKKKNAVNGSAAATDTIAFLPKKKNGVLKNSNIGASKRNGTSKEAAAAAAHAAEEEHANFMDVPIPATFVAETNLPTDVGQFRLRAYRTAKSSNVFTGNEPCVIYSADKPPFGDGSNGEFSEKVPVRIHDQCLTSEVFRSQRCDCKEQLKMALEYISENGGAIIYLQQEGRGIGLANKVAAYSLQDEGMDTVDANLHLGFAADARQYGAVPNILKDMKIGSIQLMTNNPRKVQRLQKLGVEISETLPMVVPKTNPYNHRYLEAKHNRMAHANLSPLFVKNGNMVPKRMSLADDYVTDGEEMAANAVQVSLTANNTTTAIELDQVESSTSATDEEEAGVTAREDGYCFGRESVEEAIAAVKDGKMVVVVDDMDRENEGDLIMAADACTPEDMAKIVRYSSGVICIAMEGKRMDELNLPPMLVNNEDPKGTAFTVTVDATKEHGITTGISATDRAKTVNLLADPEAKAVDFARPGHIFPLRSREGGVLTRDGHTEAAVDLSVLAGRGRSGILCEIVSEENPTEMARLPELKRFCREHGFVLTSIVDIAQYRREQEGIDENLSI